MRSRALWRSSGVINSTGTPHTPTFPTATASDLPVNVYGINVNPALTTASAVACPIFPVQLFTRIAGPWWSPPDAATETTRSLIKKRECDETWMIWVNDCNAMWCGRVRGPPDGFEKQSRSWAQARQCWMPLLAMIPILSLDRIHIWDLEREFLLLCLAS